MNVYQGGDLDEIADELVSVLERESKKKVFTLRCLDKKPNELTFDMLVIFTDKEVLKATVSVTYIDGQMGIRMQGNYLP